MNTVSILIFVAIVASSYGGFIKDRWVGRLISTDDPQKVEEERVKLRNKLIAEAGEVCTGVTCTTSPNGAGSSKIECHIEVCSPYTIARQRCAQVLSANDNTPCYYNHKEAVSGAEYPGCCEEYTKICRGDPEFKESELPTYTPEEVQECINTPIYTD